MELLINFWKSTLLATIAFWSIIFSDQFAWDMLPFVLISIIPIFVFCVITITLTIRPFFWVMKTEVFDKKAVFRTVFPYYSILCFAFCMWGIMISNNQIYFIAFFTSAFISTSQSWVWFTEEVPVQHTI